MDSVKIQRNVIKKAQTKEHFTLSLSGLFSYPSRYNPSQKRDSGCTNILPTGTLPSVRGEGQRLRKGFQGNGLRENLPLRRIDYAQGPVINAWPVGSKWLIALESLSSAAEIRHSGRIRGYEESPLPCLHL